MISGSNLSIIFENQQTASLKTIDENYLLFVDQIFIVLSPEPLTKSPFCKTVNA
jgi:hypothetical protein